MAAVMPNSRGAHVRLEPTELETSVSAPSAWTGALGETLRRSERRFLTASFLPIAVFLAALLGVAGLATGSMADFIARWRSMSLSEQLVIALALLGVNWFLASILAANWRKIVRLYEGYFLKRLARKVRRPFWGYLPGFSYHIRRQNRLPAHIIYAKYPPEPFLGDTLPTSVGNALLSAERYGLDRYGFDTTLLWPRLFWQLPAEVRESIDTFKEEHQVPIVLSFLSSLFAVLAGSVVILVQASSSLFAWSFGLAWLLSALTYLLSIERTEEYAEQVRTVTDLYRRELVAIWQDGPHRWEDDEEFFKRASSFVKVGPMSPESGPSGHTEPPGRETPPEIILPNNVDSSRGFGGPRSAGTAGVSGSGSWPVYDVRLVSNVLPKLLSPRLFVLALLFGVLVVFAGVRYLSHAHVPAQTESAGSVLRLPIYASGGQGGVPAGERVDVILRPCGLRLEDVEVVATEALQASQGGKALVFRVSDAQLIDVTGCAPENAMIARHSPSRG